MSLPAQAQAALEAFSGISSWEQRARLLMQWGDRLAPLRDVDKAEENRVQGCESQVWLVAEPAGDGWAFRAGSDARLLRGLLALLLVRVEGLSASQLEALDIGQWFQALGLGRQLSPSRSNGLNAVVQRMQALASG